MTAWDEKDTAQETGVSKKEVDKAFHQAREDARACGEIPDKDTDKDTGKDAEK